MLRQQLEHHWPSHVLAGVSLAYAAALIFFVTSMLGYADRTLGLSVERSCPDSDVIVYAETAPAVEVAAQIAQLPQVETIFVDSLYLTEVLTDTDHLTVTMRALAPPSLRTQDLVSGDFPSSSRDIAITQKLARALQMQVGQELTIIDDGAATRYTISGIYTRSPILDPVGFEAILPQVAPYFVATQGSDQGGIEVRAAPTSTPAELQEAILKIPGTVVVSSAERYQAEYARQEATLDRLTVAGPWLLTTAFLAATTVVSMTVIGVARRRAAEERTLRARGLSATERHLRLAREIGVVAGLSYLVGIGVGYAGAMGTVSILRSVDGSTVLPDQIGFPIQAALWSLVAVTLATLIGTTIGIFLITIHGTSIWRPTILATIPAVVIFAAGFLYAAIGMPGELKDHPSVDAVIGSLLLLAAMTAVAYYVAFKIARWVILRLHVGSHFALVPRSLTGLITAVAMFTILMSSAALGALHTAYSPLDVDKDRVSSVYDLAMTTAPASSSLSQKEIATVAEWGSAKSTLLMHQVNTEDWPMEEFQPGAIYAVAPQQVNDYFGIRIGSNELLVPYDTSNVPDTITFGYTDASDVRHITEAKVKAASVPFAIISMEGLGELSPIAMWMRLTDHSLINIAEDYRRLESLLGPSGDRPVLSLAVSAMDNANVNLSKIVSILQTSLILFLAFAAFGRVPRYLAEQARETRYLTAKGISFAAIQARRLAQILLSTLAMALSGLALGVACTYALMHIHGWITPQELTVPVGILALNLGSVMLACLGLGILGYRRDVSKHTKRLDLAEIGR
ncbi:ABC transporter permease [Trueperella pyogenes]|uniref:MacB-like periplasmic core domain-containing protein n=1 Tax=Trueperella pyogenes TaxID=1661 RepID=A0A3Q9GND8_9ACTO|nr:ABC transporter permease [Trueperella pyogenes]AWG03100.1 hypothetical protein DC090_00815 [Trueperella pyogenes]AWG15829.1 hypothetical protein DDE06_02725 [Trueperella pyogenes]AZR04713.1 hypothetical protein EBQ11_05330 [Trueperella pyogenes]AZR07643.1 hypothetical protein EBQ10_10325 [Trueperella pyogenes]QIU85967.1 hypothetical protein HEP79_01045 [Trueperella pyogenes]